MTNKDEQLHQASFVDQNKALNASYKIVNILKQSKSSTEKIIDDLPDIFGIIDEKGRVLKSNDSLGLLFHKRSDQLLDEVMEHLFKKEDWLVFDSCISALREKESVEFELAVGDKIFIWKLKKVSSQNKNAPMLVFFLGSDVSVLRDRERKLKILTENLQELVDEKTKDIASLLDSIDQGIFSINKDMSINEAHSKQAEVIFDTNDFKEKLFCDFLRLDDTQKKDFKGWFDVICLKNAHHKWQKFMVLCPLIQINFGDKIIKLDFRPIVKDDRIEHLLVLASDITQMLINEEKLKEAERNQNNQTQRILAITKNQSVAIQMFFDESSLYMTKFFSLLKPEHIALETRLLLILLHTFKGNSGSLGFHHLASLIHSLEDIVEMVMKSQVCDDYQWQIWQERMSYLKEEFDTILDLKTNLLNRSNNGFVVNQSAYEKLMKLFKMELADPKIRELYEVAKSLDTYKFSDMCQKYQNIIKLYREENHKNIEDLEVLTPDIFIRKDIIAAFDEGVVHLIRNAVDHGIETDGERTALQKPLGKVSLSFAHEGSYFCLKVSDNGKGINPEIICLSAIKKGLVTEEETSKMTSKEKQNLIFLSGFSTKDTLSAISGRGAGLDAVKMFMEEKNGYVIVDSTVGVGTTFSLYLPANYDPDRSLF